MFAMKIQMDEEKILKEKVIDLKKVYAALDRIFTREGLVVGEIEPDGTRNYHGTESNKDFGRCCTINRSLRAQGWFAPNCKKWLWGDNEDVTDEWEWSDMIENMRQRGLL